MSKLPSIAVPITRRSTKKAHTPPPELPVAAPARRAPRTAAPVPVRHRFHIGQRLKMLGAGRYWGRAGGFCSVIALLPAEHGAPQYRVRSEAEAFERVVVEGDLAPEEEAEIP